MSQKFFNFYGMNSVEFSFRWLKTKFICIGIYLFVFIDARVISQTFREKYYVPIQLEINDC